MIKWPMLRCLCVLPLHYRLDVLGENFHNHTRIRLWILPVQCVEPWSWPTHWIADDLELQIRDFRMACCLFVQPGFKLFAGDDVAVPDP